MRPALSSRTKRRGIAALATASAEDFNNGLDMSYLFAIWIALTQSSIVTMPRRPMITFDETVVSGTVLLLTPLLKSTTLSPSLRTIANQVERSG
jgi:hypothetical protein